VWAVVLRENAYIAYIHIYTGRMPSYRFVKVIPLVREKQTFFMWTKSCLLGSCMNSFGWNGTHITPSSWSKSWAGFWVIYDYGSRLPWTSCSRESLQTNTIAKLWWIVCVCLDVCSMVELNFHVLNANLYTYSLSSVSRSDFWFSFPLYILNSYTFQARQSLFLVMGSQILSHLAL